MCVKWDYSDRLPGLVVGLATWTGGWTAASYGSGPSTHHTRRSPTESTHTWTARRRRTRGPQGDGSRTPRMSTVVCRLSNDHDLRERIGNRTPPSDNRKRLCSCSRTLRTHLGEMSHQSRVSRLLCPARQARLAPPSVASSACDHHASPSVMTLFNYSALVRQSKPDPEEFQRGMGG